MPRGYATVRYTFEDIGRTATKSVPCSACGKRVRRQRTFTMTVNPWNVNPDGTQRTRQEIWKAIGEKIAVWEAAPEQHKKCP